MRIELIGCTGAGKSTLAGSILRAGRERDLDIFLDEGFVLDQCRLNWIKNRQLRKLFVNLAGVFASMVTWRKHRHLYLLAIQILRRLPLPWFERVNLFRNVLKKIGVSEIICFREGERQVIVVDEGPLQIAHNLFVHVSVEVEEGYLSKFAGLVPLLDTVVYLKQPEEVLIGRTMKRRHKRIPVHSSGEVARFVERAISVFDQLVQHQALKDRVLIVDGFQGAVKTANGQDGALLDLTRRIVQSGLDIGTNCQQTKTVHVEQAA